MNGTSPNTPESLPQGTSLPREEPSSSHPSRVWGVTKLLVVFFVGIALGFSLADGRTGARVVYSGAMTEVEGRSAHGPDDAPVTIVEYTDYECSFCRRYNRLVLPEILAAYDGEVRYVVRHFPLVGIHPAAVGAAVAAVCAEQQGHFWEYHDLLFAQEKGLSPESLLAYADEAGLEEGAFRECVESDEPAKVVQDDMERGATYGVRGTPAFFINGRVVFGAQPLEAFKRTIDAALEEAAGN
jgi:protein-disulfide isomerase